MKIRNLVSAAAVAASLCFVTPAIAQESSYTEGTVWEFSGVQVEPGQFENYMDYLADGWKKSLEFGVKEGVVVSYHVLSVNNPRQGEPHLILAVQYKDYATTAQRAAYQKKLETAMASDARAMSAKMGERTPMRKLVGSMETQELKLK